MTRGASIARVLPAGLTALAVALAGCDPATDVNDRNAGLAVGPTELQGSAPGVSLPGQLNAPAPTLASPPPLTNVPPTTQAPAPATKAPFGAAGPQTPGKGADPTAVPSGARLRLDRLVYDDGDRLGAALDVDDGALSRATLPLLLVAPDTGDVEATTMQAIVPGRRYRTTGGVRLAASGAAAKLDGVLTAAPGQKVYALYYPDYDADPKLGGRAQVVFDFAVVSVGARPDAAHVQPELALGDDERLPPPGGKRLGTLLVKGDAPVQLALDELVFTETRPGDLARFLQETNGRVVATDVLPEAAPLTHVAPPAAAPTRYLVRVDPARAPLGALPTLLALAGVTEPLVASRTEAVSLLALALHLRWEGYEVALNPRLQPMAAPRLTDDRGYADPRWITEPSFGVDRAWTLAGLADVDDRRVNVAFIDQGFAPNDDFRGHPDGIRQCDLGGASVVESVLRGVRCAPGAATSPPTAGNSFFGPRTWHGNMMVSVAGAVGNNGYGARGVAGQVMQPMLYRMDLASYAFEMGLGIQQAVRDGASVVNISAGYPCRLVGRFGLAPDHCTTDGRNATCAIVTGGLVTAAATVCASAAAIASIPIVGPLLAVPLAAACGTANALAVAGTAACFSTLLAGDLRGNLERGVAFASARGVPVVASAGNVISRDDVPEVLRDLVDLTNTDADAWGVIPCTIPTVICVGQTEAAPPHRNLQFRGRSVDVFAPAQGIDYWAPPTTDAVVPADRQVLTSTAGGGTSAAAAYVSGTLALLMALNPDLDPRSGRHTAAALPLIPGRLLGLLRGTGTPSPDAPGEILVNPFAALRRAGAGVLPDFAGRGYDTALDFDEATGPNGDTETTAFDLGPATLRPTFTGTIHNLPAVTTSRPGVRGVTSRDTDWVRFGMPGLSGLYQARVEIRVPAALGRLQVGGLTLVEERPGFPTPTELTLVYTTPPLLGGGEARFFLTSDASGSDNVYALAVHPAVRVGEADVDRFDRNDPAVTPPESRPDNDEPTRAVRLGARGDAWTGPLDWVPADPTRDGRPVHRIALPGLTFHRAADVDWFAVVSVPSHRGHDAPGCQPSLRVQAGPGVRVELHEGGRLVRAASGTLELATVPALPARFRLVNERPGTFVRYEATFEFEGPSDLFCRGPFGGAFPWR